MSNNYVEIEVEMENVVKEVTKEVLKEETDPTVPECVKTITQNDIDKWNKEETDPTVPTHVKNITETDIANWNAKATVIASTEDLEAGVSELDTGVVYLVYEE